MDNVVVEASNKDMGKDKLALGTFLDGVEEAYDKDSNIVEVEVVDVVDVGDTVNKGYPFVNFRSFELLKGYVEVTFGFEFKLVTIAL